MPTVRELSDRYTNFMLNPLPPGSGDVCPICLTFTNGYPLCYGCSGQPQHAGAVLPISYSVHFGQLHTSLRAYKRGDASVARRLQLELAAVLWRFLELHEACLARHLGIDEFELVTTVPSGSRERDEVQPLRRIVGDLVAPTRGRYERLLVRSLEDVADRVVDLRKYEATRELDGENMLLVDDTWTSGASVQIGAGVLRRAGAGAVGALVIGRHVHAEYRNNQERLDSLNRPYRWNQCAFE
jgi:hypothetical protein